MCIRDSSKVGLDLLLIVKILIKSLSFFLKGETANASVTITVVNVNEAPSFTLSSYSGVIAENSVNGVDIITIPATDPDSGDTLTYSLSGSGTFRLIRA